jgi:hypothetical protein
MIVKRIGPLSIAKVAGMLYGILGLIVGCFVALFSLVGGAVSEELGGAALGALFGVGAVIFLPILYGFLGFLMALVGAALYNLAAGWIGGIEVQIEGVQ